MFDLIDILLHSSASPLPSDNFFLPFCCSTPRRQVPFFVGLPDAFIVALVERTTVGTFETVFALLMLMVYNVFSMWVTLAVVGLVVWFRPPVYFFSPTPVPLCATRWQGDALIRFGDMGTEMYFMVRFFAANLKSASRSEHPPTHNPAPNPPLFSPHVDGRSRAVLKLCFPTAPWSETLSVRSPRGWRV